MQEIKFCKFCGNNELDIEVTLDRESGKKYRVHCRQCGANGPLRNDEDNAILWWNNRINEAPTMPQERPNIILDDPDEYNSDEFPYCPFNSVNSLDIMGYHESVGSCKFKRCMMWVSVGEDKGRCGLVNTQYINSTVCGA